jgi:hypothetical protein
VATTYNTQPLSQIMFLSELTPLVKELTQQPLAFFGGFFSGVLRLNLGDEPVNSWLQRQTGIPYTPPTTSNDNGKSQGPQSIEID